MGRFHREMLAGLLVAGAAVVASTGCADNDSSLFIQGVLLEQPPDCDVTADPSSTMLGQGFVDLAFEPEFTDEETAVRCRVAREHLDYWKSWHERTRKGPEEPA